MGTCLFSRGTMGSDGADFHSCSGNDGGDISFFHCTQASIGSMYWGSPSYISAMMEGFPIFYGVMVIP